MSTCRLVVSGDSWSAAFVVSGAEAAPTEEIRTKSLEPYRHGVQNVYFCCERRLCVRLDSYLAALLVDALRRSPPFRAAWLRFVCPARTVFVLESLPHHFYLDTAWGERTEVMARERAEVESAFSWLSTLGGAFSALGDSFSHCAVMAGKISWAQLRLALRLGDPVMRARCLLYVALSLAQQGRFGSARRIVRQVRLLQPSLANICLGVRAHFVRLKMTQRGS